MWACLRSALMSRTNNNEQQQTRRTKNNASATFSYYAYYCREYTPTLAHMWNVSGTFVATQIAISVAEETESRTREVICWVCTRTRLFLGIGTKCMGSGLDWINKFVWGTWSREVPQSNFCCCVFPPPPLQMVLTFFFFCWTVPPLRSHRTVLY